MNIGIMCHSSFGGSARIATELAAELARRGHTVHLFTHTTPFGRWDHASRVRLHQAAVDGESDIHPATLYTDWSVQECEALVSQILHVNVSSGSGVVSQIPAGMVGIFILRSGPKSRSNRRHIHSRTGRR